MDHPDTEEVTPEKLEEVKEEILSFSCDLYDSEIIHKIALALLPGLGAACIDNTTGGLFRSPASVALDLRRAMVEYLTVRSETFVAESIILEDSPEASDHPYDIIADFIEDFGTSKRNIFSRVSGWILSERREDRIDDFVQDMEMDGFWILDRRESIAKTLLKNVDTKNLFHCNMKFNTEEELAEHSLNCSFRTIDCMHEGCDARFSATHLENHESICPFKIIPCEQKCPANIMRRQMDRHCITVCPMKVINCTFSSAGCQSTFPQSETEHHRIQTLLYHIGLVLRVIHKDNKDAADEDLEERSKKVEEMASPGKLVSARDVRSLTLAIKDAESKLGPLQVRPKQELPTTESENTESTMETNQAIVEKESNKEDNQKPSSPPPIKGILKTTDNSITKDEDADQSTNKSNSPTIKKESIMPVVKEDNNGLIKSSSMKGTSMVSEDKDIKESNDSLSMKENLKDTAEEDNKQPNRPSSMKGNLKNTEEEEEAKDSLSMKENQKGNKEDNKQLNSSSSMKESFNASVNAKEEDDKKELPNVSSSTDRSLNTNEVYKEESNVSPLVKESSKANEEEEKKESIVPPLLKESLKTNEEEDNKEANASPMLKESLNTSEE